MKPKSFSATKAKKDRRNCTMRNLAHGGACRECASNCMLVHGNQVDPSSSVSRFFKIMLGKDFSEVMFVPCKVARENKWHKYINREACLEDTTGEKYPVKISEIGNVVAFKEGWSRFSSDHHLEVGDFLLFNHIRHVKNLHFIVHIFGKSAAEKVFFSRGHDKNGSTVNRNAALRNKSLKAKAMTSDSRKSPIPSVVPNPLCNDIHHDSLTTNNTPSEYTDGKMLQQPEPAPWDVEPLYMLPRDDLCIEDRTCLYDLWSFENNDHPAAAVVSIGKDELGTVNHAEKIMEPQRDSDLPGMFPVKRKCPETQPYKKQIAVVENTSESTAVKVAPQFQRDWDLLDTLPVKRKFSSPESQPYKKRNAITENIIESALVNVVPEMKMAVNGGERSSSHVQKIIKSQDRFSPADDIPVQRDVSGSKSPSYKAMLDNKKNVDRYGSASIAQDKTQKVGTCGTVASGPVNVPPGMQMAVNDGERSRTHVQKMIEWRDRCGPADNIKVQGEVSLANTPSHKAKLAKKKFDRSGPASSAQYSRQNVATGGAIKTIKKELDLGDELFYHQQSLSVKKQTISPENVRRFSSNIKKDVKIPKTEPFCSENISASFVGMESSSAEVEDKPYLVLQSELPSVLLPREKLRTIYLRAPDEKVFPVIYTQKNGVRVLTSGWQVFKSMNHLHAGDRCRIELEDASKRIYRFEVLSRGAVMNLK